MSQALLKPREPAAARPAKAFEPEAAGNQVPPASPAGMPAYLGSIQFQCDVCRDPEEALQRAPSGSALGEGAPAGGAHGVASAGVADASAPLPFADHIQTAFGGHDVTGARAQVGGSAAEAAGRLGARAYTLGDRIGFRAAPDLRLAAHEAAHVVQQRRGVQLKDAVGREGDVYEQQADAVAERVVAGQSAEDLLGPVADSSAEGNSAAVQAKCECGGTGCAKCASGQEPRRDEDEEPRSAALQFDLEANALRQFEPDASGSGAGAAVSSVDPGGASALAPEEEEEETSAGPAPADGSTDEASADAPAMAEEEPEPAPVARGGGAPAPSGGGAAAPMSTPRPMASSTGLEGPPVSVPPAGSSPSVVATSGEGGAASETATAAPEAAAESAGGGMNASCYNAEIEEPEEDPEEEPAEPEPTEVREDISSESPEAEDGDECPVGEGLASAEAAAPEGEGAAPDAALASEAASAGGEAARSGAAAGGALGGAGATEAGALEAGAGIESTVADTQVQRDAAVAAYLASRLRLGDAGAGVRTVTEPLPVAGLGEHQRRIAGAANGFLGNAATRVDEVVNQALGALPDRIGALAESIKAGIGTAIDTEKISVSARVAQARAQALGQAGSARARVQAGHDRAAAGLQASADAALAALDAQYPMAMGRIDDAETFGLDDITSAYATSHQNHVDLGTAVGEEAIARGDAYAAEYESCKINERDSWTAGYLTDRRAEAQQNAARQVAQGYQTSLQEAATDQANTLNEGRQRDRCGARAMANQARDSLDQQHAALAEAIRSGLDAALAQAAASRDQLMTSIDSGLLSTLDTLDAQERTQRQAANDTGYLQQVAVEQAAHSATATLIDAMAQAVDGVADLLRQTRAAMGDLADADPDAASAHLARLDSTLGAALSRLLGQAVAGTGRVEEQLMGSAAQAEASMLQLADGHAQQTTGHSEGFAQSMQGLVRGATSSFEAQVDQHAAQTSAMADSGLASFEQIATGVESGIETMVTNIGVALGESEAALDASLHQSLARMDDASEGIPHHAQEAASKEQPAWKSIVKWVLIIAIVIVVAMVIGPAVIGAVGAAAGALGASAAAATVIGTVVGGAIVGAATSTVIQVVNNWAAGVDLGTGLVRAAVMGAIGGALGGAAGQLLGRAAQAYAISAPMQFAMNVASDMVLELGTELVTGEFSWESMGMALVMTMATGGFGEIPRVRAVQARVQFGAASRVPGAGATRFAESIRPPDVSAPAARPEIDAPDAPARVAPPDADAPATRASEDGAAVRDGEVARPRSDTELSERVGEVEGGAPPRADDAPRLTEEADTPLNQRTDGELAEATTPARVGDADHGIAPRRMGDRVELWGCSAACGHLGSKLEAMAASLPARGKGMTALRRRVAALQSDVRALEAEINSGALSSGEIIPRLAEISQRLEALGEAHPRLGAAMDAPVADTSTPIRERHAGEWGVDPVTGRVDPDATMSGKTPAEVDAEARRPEPAGGEPNDAVRRRRRYLQERPDPVDQLGMTAWAESGFRANVNRDVSSPIETAAIGSVGGTLNNQPGQRVESDFSEPIDARGRATTPEDAVGTRELTTRPDGTRPSTRTRPDGTPGTDIVEHKHLTGDSVTLDDSPQLRAQREMAEANHGYHELVISSDYPLVPGGRGVEPRPRVSSGISGSSTRDIYYFDTRSGRATHRWNGSRWLPL